MSVSVAVLFPVFVSDAPAPAATVTLLRIGPLAPEAIVPLTVSVSVLPGTRLAFVKLMLLPAVPFVPHAAVPLAMQLTATPVMVAGTTSVMATPVAVDGPAFKTTIV